jgi:hypothetical protein
LKRSSTAAYQSYLSISRNLIKIENNKAIYNELLDELIKCSNTLSDDDMPFIFYESSSGMGKTQLAMTLPEFAPTKDVKFYFYYLLCSPVGSDSQRIYKSFAERTDLFRDCVKRDMIDTELDLECRKLAQRKLFTYGFIIAALQQYVCTDVFITYL